MDVSIHRNCCLFWLETWAIEYIEIYSMMFPFFNSWIGCSPHAGKKVFGNVPSNTGSCFPLTKSYEPKKAKTSQNQKQNKQVKNGTMIQTIPSVACILFSVHYKFVILTITSFYNVWFLERNKTVITCISFGGREVKQKINTKYPSKR